MEYLYARISTPNQKVERQIENILRIAPNVIIFQEAYTGCSLNRPEWKRLMKIVQPGDTIYFDEVSRMSRDAEEGVLAYEELYNRKVELVFLKQPHINTATYRLALNNALGLTGSTVDYIIEGINRYLMALAHEQIRLAFEQSECEVELLRNRTKEGLRVAKANGKVLGRKEGSCITTKKCTEAKRIIQKHSRTFGGSLDDGEVMKLCGIARNSYYKYKRQLAEELNEAC